jgi:L-alanine-DL-glutamate epimerase-like enolase superfamily enzyme
MHDYRTTENILLELDAGDVVGRGHVFAFLPAHADAIRAIVEDLAQFMVGRDISRLRHVHGDLLRRINFIGAGPAIMAVGAVDTALWDLHAQAAGMPLNQLLGSVHEELPVYASGGWWTYSKEELAEEGLQLAEQGFKGYKIKVGHADWHTDLERVEHLLAEVADRIPVMVDANQAWTEQIGIEAGRAFESLGVSWFEEPVPAYDVEASARVTDALDVTLASGETVFSRHGFRPLIEGRAVDVLMINLNRSGGPAEFLHVAAQAEAHGIPVSSHTYTEASTQVMLACPNAGSVEYIPGWWDGLFEDPPPIQNGMVRSTDRPGLGYRFSERAIHEYGAGE